MAALPTGSDGKYSVVVLPGTYKVEIIGSTVYAHGWYSAHWFHLRPLQRPLRSLSDLRMASWS